MTTASPPHWVVVIAPGQPRRPGSSGADAARDPAPLFSVKLGGRLLLEHTVERLEPLTTAARTVVIVARRLELDARTCLAERTGIHIIPQPENRGSGLGVLLGLAYVMARDPLAHVVLAPSDHVVSDPAPLLAAIETAFQVDDQVPLVLLGMVPDDSVAEHEWIVPGKELPGGARAVSFFVPHPRGGADRALVESGALWNSFIVVGRAQAIWNACGDHLPQHVATFVAHLKECGDLCLGRALKKLYHSVAPVDFGRDVLQHIPHVAVVPVAGSGWSDWSTPDRVTAALEQTPDLDATLERVPRRRRARTG